MTDRLSPEVEETLLSILGGGLALLVKALRDFCQYKPKRLRHHERLKRVERDLNKLASNLPPGKGIMIEAWELDSADIVELTSWDSIHLKYHDLTSDNTDEG